MERKGTAEKRRILCIRADGNREIATGHLRRCLSVAQAAKKKGVEVCFAVADTESKRLLASFLTKEESKAFPVTVLGTSYHRPEEELPALFSFLEELPKPAPREVRLCLLVDSYFATEVYLRALQECAETAYIDDLYAFDPPVTYLLNYHWEAERKRKSYKAAEKLLLGVSYAPLRERFADSAYTVSGKIKKILVSTGGGDPYHLMRALVKRAEEFSAIWHKTNGNVTPLEVHLLLGALYTDREDLQGEIDGLAAETKKSVRFILHENIPDTEPLMRNADMAFSAAGTTLYELCAVGVPCCCFSFADNQMPMAREFSESSPKNGTGRYLGDMRELGAEGLTDRLLAELRRALADAGGRRAQSQWERETIDGRGSERIVDALFSGEHSSDN